MNGSMVHYILISLSCFFLISSCVSKNNNETDVSVEVNGKEAGKAEKERRQLSEELRKLRDDIDKEINRTSLKIEKASEENKVNLKHKQEDLTERRSKLEMTIDKVDNSSDEAWTDVKTTARNTLNNIKGEFREIENEIGG